MISVCFLFFKIPLPRGGSYPSIVIPTGAKHRVQSPLERWPRMISTDRPEMESRPYECLLHSPLLMLLVSIRSVICILYLSPLCHSHERMLSTSGLQNSQDIVGSRAHKAV